MSIFHISDADTLKSINFIYFSFSNNALNILRRGKVILPKSEEIFTELG